EGDDWRRGRRRHARGCRLGRAGGVALPPHHSWDGNWCGTGAGASRAAARPPRGEVRLRAAATGRHRRHHRGVLAVSLIPDEVIEQVKDATDILSLVGESVDLKRTGSDWRGCCPF